MSSVTVDEDSQIPSYDSFNMLGNNKLPFIILLIVVIFIYIFLFSFLNNISVDNENTKWWILLLEIILIVVLIIVVALNIDSFTEYNFIAEIKNLFTSKLTEINVTVDKDSDKTTECTNTDASSGEVFNIPHNTYTYDQAKEVCSELNARLATYNEVETAYNAGGNWCSYGWSDEQMALFPTQKDVYNKLKAIPGHAHDCGRPGVNGGYIDNKYFKFGVNCYGKKPYITEKNKNFMDNYSYSPSLTDASYNDISNNETSILNILIAPFNKSKWSYE
jgi:hypothetical protein